MGGVLLKTSGRGPTAGCQLRVTPLEKPRGAEQTGAAREHYGSQSPQKHATGLGGGEPSSSQEHALSK